MGKHFFFAHKLIKPDKLLFHSLGFAGFAILRLNQIKGIYNPKNGILKNKFMLTVIIYNGGLQIHKIVVVFAGPDSYRNLRS